MANAPIGLTIIAGCLKVVKLDYDSIDLGKTTADTELTPEEDNKDIMYQQDGTKPQDKIPTGISYTLTCTLGEISTTKVEKLLRGTEKSGSGNSMKYGRNIYISRRENAKKLIVTAVDSAGALSTDALQILNFYKASPEVTGPIQWGADTQRNLPISFYIFYDETEEAFGYHGHATSFGLTP